MATNDESPHDDGKPRPRDKWVYSDEAMAELMKSYYTGRECTAADIIRELEKRDGDPGGEGDG